jgi:hypothetical protein
LDIGDRAYTDLLGILILTAADAERFELCGNEDRSGTASVQQTGVPPHFDLDLAFVALGEFYLEFILVGHLYPVPVDMHFQRFARLDRFRDVVESFRCFAIRRSSFDFWSFHLRFTFENYFSCREFGSSDVPFGDHHGIFIPA